MKYADEVDIILKSIKLNTPLKKETDTKIYTNDYFIYFCNIFFKFPLIETTIRS